jgi:DegV family protein with EDD domain
MKRKIVADSSVDIQNLSQMEFVSVPLTIHAGDASFRDDEALAVGEMVQYLRNYKGKSSTACPSAGDFLAAFGEAEEVFCFTITSKLSGAYQAACIAKEEYESAHPDRRVCVVDSLSTGPEMRLLAEKVESLTAEGKSFEEVEAEVRAYSNRTQLIFMLESLKNLANNGRVSHAVAKITGILGIRLVGKAQEGELFPLDKCRGLKKALDAMVERMKSLGYRGGKVHIAHCFHPEAAHALLELLRQEFKNLCAEIYPTGGLCSFYAELGGLLVGFET